jgi:hypothetical protein
MLKERIHILEEAKIISNVVADFTNSVIDLLNKYPFEESKLEMFTTHFAMATQRIFMKDNEFELDEEIWTQVQKDKNFLKANVLLSEIISGAPCYYSEGEKKFLVLHLCNLLDI